MRTIIVLVLVSLLSSTHTFAQDEAKGAMQYLLPVNGRITDGENKLEGCRIVTFDANEADGELTTDKSGKF